MGKNAYFNRGDPVSGLICHSNNESQGVSRCHSSEEVRESRMEQRTEQLISWSKSQLRVLTIHMPRGVPQVLCG